MGGGGCIGQRLRLALAQMRSELEELRAEQSLSIIHYTVRPGKNVAKFSDNLVKSKYLTSSMLGYFWHSTNYKIQMRRLLCFKNMNLERLNSDCNVKWRVVEVRE